MSSTMSRALLGLVLILSAGCSTSGRPAWFPFTWPSADERTARPPDSEARPGESKAARGTPDRTDHERPGDPAGALYRLGLLQADPTSGIRDYRAARATFTRLLSEYPRSRWDAEARAWQATLTDLLLREDEARQATQQWQRSEQDGKRSKMNLERLRQLDLDQERRR
jgi:TolA-binding protein